MSNNQVCREDLSLGRENRLKLLLEDDIPRLCQIRKQQLIDEGAEPGINIDDELHWNKGLHCECVYLSSL